MQRIALVTGAGRRLGAEIAKGLALDGYFVIITYNRSGPAARQVASEIEAAGGKCGVLHADLTDRAVVETLIDRCRDLFGLPVVLINNASSYIYDSMSSLSAESWHDNLATNLESPLFLSVSFFNALRPHRGVIVNMLDFKVVSLNPDYFSYTVAKVGMAGATRMLAMAFKGIVRVNSIAPGLAIKSGRQTDEQFHRAWAMTPLGRGPTSKEIVAAVKYTIATNSLNGQIITLDGGASLRPRDRDISVDPSALETQNDAAS